MGGPEENLLGFVAPYVRSTNSQYPVTQGEGGTVQGAGRRASQEEPAPESSNVPHDQQYNGCQSRGTVEMTRQRASGEEQAPESSNIPQGHPYNGFPAGGTTESSYIPHDQWHNGYQFGGSAESINVPHGEQYNVPEEISQGPNEEHDVADAGIVAAQANVISHARRYARIEVVRRFGLDTIAYREEVEAKLEAKFRKKGKHSVMKLAYVAESPVAIRYINELDRDRKLKAEQQIDSLIGIVLDEPDWKQKKLDLSWKPSANVENMQRTPADWVNVMINRVAKRCGTSTSKTQKEH
jgi:hypothetical protein